MDRARSQPEDERVTTGTAGAGGGAGVPGAGSSGHAEAQTANHDGLDDGTLLAQAGQGDRDAYMMLYQRYERRVYGLVVTLVGRGPAADDAFQDAMWELWRRASAYDARLGSASSWILMLARSRAIDVARRRTRVKKLERAAEERARGVTDFGTGDAERSARAHGAGIDAGEIDMRALGEKAARLVAELPKEQQIVVRMAFMQGLTREQISEALNVPVGTVKTRLRTAVRSLSGSMAAAENEAGRREENQGTPR